ncbi:1-aminocyclopropane-1-carboxylate deaminase/D-cysteine desulfhydrase [Bacterioplanoides sp. SCSIO 12839]|uniref:1-aminocyclopropane-1-carboxylate deaminase/D-cysteine desulfhydrase n=1 Tax=Bacterioplanoides sp. SCSIO 12839 TaxID=2829569 RepID=UPI002103B338|nr:pyridoxal-phosphate dependent enzyme [Bacterioplanoides sp. SCSIO 12839]UTW49444.1 pyridoxal-phosphate dependent enzyme [Bacterioplanoides sp. SCSIO 12839]
MLTKLLSFKPSLIEPVVNLSACDVLRLDQIDAQISGNKVFKLLGHLQRAEEQGFTKLLSFGGPYSNHLHALAAVGERLDIPTVGVVRGYSHVPLTPTLEDCQAMGMALVFADKKTYVQRYLADYQQQLATEYKAYVIGEGGQGASGEEGCELLARYCQRSDSLPYDEVWLAVGTGTTALGLAKALHRQGSQCRVVGVNAVADQGECLQRWQQNMPSANWQLFDQYHHGGFGKCPEVLRALIQRYDQQDLPLDPVYTAKLFWAYEQQLLLDPELAEKRVLLVHSGGLQGRRGFSL